MLAKSIMDFVFPTTAAITVYSEPYLDRINKEYVRILTLDGMPEGALKPFVKPINMQPLSPFHNRSIYDDPFQCTYALIKQANHRMPFFQERDMPSLIAFLKQNGYNIDMDMFKIVNKLGTQQNTVTGSQKKLLFTFI
jgi:hypothetical protein